MKDTCQLCYLREDNLSPKEFKTLAEELLKFNVVLDYFRDKYFN